MANGDFLSGIFGAQLPDPSRMINDDGFLFDPVAAAQGTDLFAPRAQQSPSPSGSPQFPMPLSRYKRIIKFPLHPFLSNSARA